MRETDFDAQRRRQYEALDEAHTVVFMKARQCGQRNALSLFGPHESRVCPRCNVETFGEEPCDCDEPRPGRDEEPELPPDVTEGDGCGPDCGWCGRCCRPAPRPRVGDPWLRGSDRFDADR